MPARLVITAAESELAALFGLPPSATGARSLSKARYNVAPLHDVPVVRMANGTRELADLRWGLVPHWTTDAAHEGFVNARSETVAQKPSFRSAFRARRCLVPANGFYGWKPGLRRKQPYYFRPSGNGVFVCAGIWDRWDAPGGPVETVAVLTMPSNALVKPMDERMPVVVGEEHFAAWLDPNEANPEKLLALFTPYPADQMTCWPVNTRVNDPAEDDADLLTPLAGPL